MTRALGIDVSHWSGHVNWTKAKAAGASFMFAKASQWVKDPLFAENWGNAKAAGLLRGAYHYLDFGWSEIKQAELFVKTMNGDYGELPPVLDLEQHYVPYGLSAIGALGRAANFMSIVERMTGKVPMLYGGYYYANFTYPARNWDRFPFWLAWYAPEWYIKLRSAANTGTGVPKPWKDWKFWQYTDKGDGVKYGCQELDVDLNVFNGTVEELYAFANKPVPPTPLAMGLYKVTSFTLKVFAGAGDMYKQVAIPLTYNTQVKVLQTMSSNGELWARIESPAGWVRLANLMKVGV